MCSLLGSINNNRNIKNDINGPLDADVINNSAQTANKPINTILRIFLCKLLYISKNAEIETGNNKYPNEKLSVITKSAFNKYNINQTYPKIVQKIYTYSS